MFRVLGVFISAAVILADIATGTAMVHARKRIHPPPETGIQDRYCLQGVRWGYPGNCQFSTYSQCMATASGTPDYCGLNPTYAFQEWRGPK